MTNVIAIALLLWLAVGNSISCVFSLIVPPISTKNFGPYHSTTTSIVLKDQQQRGDGIGRSGNNNNNNNSSSLRTSSSSSARSRQNNSWQPGGPRRRNISASQIGQEKVDSFLRKFANKEEINQWMQDKVNENDSEKLATNSFFPQTWSSRDETDFIRALRDMGAYQALELFVYRFARKNVFVYTAAISALANSRDRRMRFRALRLLDKMDEDRVLPTSFTFEALFQSIDGPEAAKQLMTRLEPYNKRTKFSVESFNQAIMACSRTPPRRHPTNKSWQLALDFAHNLRRQGLRPNLKTYTSLLHVCAQTGQVRIAMSLFREIESNPDLTPNERVYGSLLNVCAQAGNYKLASDLLQTMKKNENPINLYHCSAFLKALSMNGKVEISLQVLDMMTGVPLSHQSKDSGSAFQATEIPRIAPDLVALNTILKCCAQAGDFSAARKLVDRMKEGDFTSPGRPTRIYPDETSYSLLLSSCSDPIEARAILREMHLSRRHRLGVVRPCSITYARAVAVCRRAEVPDVESVRFFLESAQKDEIKPTVFMYSAAIWTAERSGNYTVAKHFLEEMQAKGVRPNTICYTGVISAASKNGQVEEASLLWKEMTRRGCMPTVATYNAMALCVRNSNLMNKTEILESIFNSLDEGDRRVDVGGPIIETLIKEYCMKGEYTGARRVFDMIEGPCNGQCLRAMLLACAVDSSGPRWEEAISILHSSDITSTAIGPGEMDQGALTNAMIACARADRWEEGLNLLQLYGVKTPRKTNSISVVALNAIMAACGRKGRPDVAFSVLNDMERYGIKPDERSYRSVVVACNQAEHQKRRLLASSSGKDKIGNEDEAEPTFQWWEASVALLRRMREDGLQPDIQTFSSCISACEAAGQWQRALAILQSMIDSNPEGNEAKFLNLFCFNAAISSCEKGGAWVEALEVYERMISYGGPLQPNFVTLSSLVLALANAGQKELADSKYLEGLTKLRIVKPWRTTRDSNGDAIKAMDLHKFNAAMACSAVRGFLDPLLKRGEDSVIEEDLIIIVGKGLRSAEEAILLPTLQELLRKEYGIYAEADAGNKGRIVIKSKELRELIAGRSW